MTVQRAPRRGWDASEAARLAQYARPEIDERCACAECRCTSTTSHGICGFCRQGMHEEGVPSD